jgi:hypothetical protein
VRIHKTLRTTPAMAARVTERLWEIGDVVNVLEGWEAAKRGAPIWEKSHGMVQPENIDSGHSNFQLDTRCGGYSRNLDYLLVSEVGRTTC